MSEDSSQLEAEIDPVDCPECGETTNKFLAECDNCGYERWADD